MARSLVGGRSLTDDATVLGGSLSRGLRHHRQTTPVTLRRTCSRCSVEAVAGGRGLRRRSSKNCLWRRKPVTAADSRHQHGVRPALAGLRGAWMDILPLRWPLQQLPVGSSFGAKDFNSSVEMEERLSVLSSLIHNWDRSLC